MIYQTIQDFPAGIGQTDVTLRAVNVVGVQESAYSFARETQVFPGARWELEISIQPSTREHARKLEAFLISLRGRAGRFRLADPYRSLPLGLADGAPMITTATAGAETLVTRNWTPSRNGQLLAGDFIEIEKHLHMLTVDANSDASGNATLTVWPPLRETSPDGVPVILRNARGVFALDSNSVEFTRDTNGFNGATLRAVEVVAGRERFRTLSPWGDSITQQNSWYACNLDMGVGYAMQYKLMPTVPNPHEITVTHLNPGGTGPLAVLMTGNDLVVTLARTSGTVTSTINDVRNAVIAAYGSIFRVNDYGGSPSTDLAQAQAKTWFTPGSYFEPHGILAWVQALLRQRFDFVRRNHNLYGAASGDPVGDWTHGYSGQRADQLVANPGPLGDLIADGGDAILGCAGANDVIQGASAATIRDRIVAMWRSAPRGNVPLLWLEVPPSGDATRQAVIVAANALLRPLAPLYGVVLIPWNPALLSAGVAAVGYFPDQTHPNNAAAFLQASYMLPWVEPFVQVLAPDYAGDTTWITANPQLAGTTGGLATGWINYYGGTVTPSKFARDGREWQRMTVAQPGLYDVASLVGPSATTGWSPGDKVEGVATIKCQAAGWDVKAVVVKVYFSGAGGAFIASMNTFFHDIDFSPGLPFDAVLRTPPACIPHGTTSVNVSIDVYGSGTLDFIDAGVRLSTQA